LDKTEPALPDVIAPQNAFASACPTNLIELSPEPESLAGGWGAWLGGGANPAVRHASTCRHGDSAGAWQLCTA